jgi:hypothetical protein
VNGSPSFVRLRDLDPYSLLTSSLLQQVSRRGKLTKF